MPHFRKQGLYFSNCHHQDRLRLPQIIKSWFLSVWLFFHQFVPLFSHFNISSKLKIGPQAIGLWSSQSLELWFWALAHVRNTWENKKILIRRSHPSTMKLESLVLRPRLQCFLKSPPAYTTVQIDLRNTGQKIIVPHHWQGLVDSLQWSLESLINKVKLLHYNRLQLRKQNVHHII